MKLPKDATMLAMDSPTFAEDFAAAIGLQPGEKLEISTPQFERTDNVQVPQSVDFSDWANLRTKDDETLRALGFGVWDKDERGTHWLFPKEWYSVIPNGLIVTDINGEDGPFIRGETDDDYRFGCLPFGFIKPAIAAQSAQEKSNG
jgi:hypothetical protein